MGAQNSMEHQQALTMNPPRPQAPINSSDPPKEYQQFIKNNVKQFNFDPSMLQINLINCGLSEENLQTVLLLLERAIFEKEKQHKQSLKLRIFLVNNNFSGLGSLYLAKASLANLQEIHLHRNHIGDQACVQLSKAHWPMLAQIGLDDNEITGKGCKYLSQARWNNLNGIFLSDNRIGEKGIKHLVKAEWPALDCLKVASSKIGDKGCIQITKGNWSNLKVFGFGKNYNGTTDKGCQALLKSVFNKLDFISLDGNSITQFTLGFMRERYSKCFKMYFEKEDQIFW